MKYGINQHGLDRHCANCNKTVGEENYCKNCGAPLTVSAIADFEEHNQFIVDNTIKELKEISKKNKTTSLTEILKTFNDENN